MNKKMVIIMVIIASVASTVGIVRAAGMTADWLRVGTQDEGGVTFFNGTIINETTGDDDADNPVTFGDNVRIDGRVYRGATAGTSDSMPFIVNDNMEIAGTLAVGNITATGLTGSGIVSSDNLASNAVTQGVEDNNTTITTIESGTNYATAAEVSITTGDSPLFCMFSGYGTTDAINQSIKIALIVDDVIQVNSYRSATMGDGVGHIILTTNGIYSMTAGAHTIQLGWNTDTGATASLYFNTLDCIELKK
ncbi:hypothetical protein KJ810_01325 [Patescibacteria group bacterium]|nr:hypothetical protein [Patescibacteria group bacterium]